MRACQNTVLRGDTAYKEPQQNMDGNRSKYRVLSQAIGCCMSGLESQ